MGIHFSRAVRIPKATRRNLASTASLKRRRAHEEVRTAGRSVPEPVETTCLMSQELEQIFGELGIPQYLEAFVDQGFDTWDTILDITESDL